MLGFSGLAQIKTFKKPFAPRTIANLSSYDLDFVNDKYKGGTMTFTGSGLATDIFRYGGLWYTAGHTEQADGSVVLKPASNERRTDLGLWVEQARTNAVLYSRDLTNTAWVKTNITAAKNIIGVDKVTNSASTILATAGDATILQPITLASSQRFQSAYIRRVTGSGNIFMTMDGGTTWTNITYQVNGAWTRISLPTALLTDPQVGFKIATSGDSFGIDFVQNENGNTISSPRETTSAAVNSWGDRATADDSGGSYLSPLPPLLRAGHGFYMEFSSAVPTAQVGPLVSSGGTQARIETTNAFSYQGVLTGAGQFVRGKYNFNKIAAYIKADGSVAVCCNGNAVVTGTGVLGSGMAHMDLGTNGSQSLAIHGTIKRVAFFNANVLTDADLINFTKP